jgi:Sulfotransferase family
LNRVPAVPIADPSPPKRDRLRFSPVFVLATARSCSSVVSAMIGQHPDLFWFPELKLFAYATIGELDASLPREMRKLGFAHRSPGLVRTVAELEFGGQSDDALAASCAWLHSRSDWTGAQVLDLLMDRASPRVAVEKSPENVVTDGPLTRLVYAYPRARYLHLTRHPVATIESMNAHLRRTLPGSGSADFWHTASKLGSIASGVSSRLQRACQSSERSASGRRTFSTNQGRTLLRSRDGSRFSLMAQASKRCITRSAHPLPD